MNKAKLSGRMAEAGLSQRELARRLRKNKNTVNRKFNGQVPFTADEIVAIGEILGITSPKELAEIFLPLPYPNGYERLGGGTEPDVCTNDTARVVP